MRTAELIRARNEGRPVLVHLPYDGGHGWAKVLAANAIPPPRQPAKTAVIELLDGEGSVYSRRRHVRPADIIRPAHPNELPQPERHP